MKVKNILKSILFVVLMVSFSGAAFAVGNISIDASFGTTGKTLYGSDSDHTASSGADAAGVSLIGKTSTGVAVGVLTNASGYALVTQHKNGSRAYGTSYDSTSIYSGDATVGTPLLTVPTATDTSNFTGTDWDIQ